jgi:hypothetical protein
VPGGTAMARLLSAAAASGASGLSVGEESLTGEASLAAIGWRPQAPTANRYAHPAHHRTLRLPVTLAPIFRMITGIPA